MNERAKITANHLSRQAIVYLRQSSAAQVENNRESTERQYALAGKARELGWPADRIVVIHEDLGLSGSGFVARSGFARLTAEVALAHVGLVLGLEVSRLARNNADWHASSNSAASPIRSSATPTASIIPPFSTIASCSGSTGRRHNAVPHDLIEKADFLVVDRMILDVPWQLPVGRLDEPGRSLG